MRNATTPITGDTPKEGGRTRRRVLAELNKKLVMTAPLVPPEPDKFAKPKGVERWTFNLHGQPVDRRIIYFRSDVGCEYGLKTGGCTGCRHWRLGTAGQRVELEDKFVRQYHAAIAELGYAPVMCLYNEGNMLNDYELPQSQLKAILRDLALNGVKRVVLEARPEYITRGGLGLLAEAANGMSVEVGIGLESSNDFIRNQVFLKAMSLPNYEAAVQRLHEFGMRALAYVILKPPFLNEAQAVRDTVNTIYYALSVGTDAVSVEPIGIEPHTVTALLAAAGHFKPARLWSLVRVAQLTRGLGEVRLGGFQFMPLPEGLPRNCDSCTAKVLEAIDRYNHTYDLAHLDSVRCEWCQASYERDLLSEPWWFDEEELAEDLAGFVDAAQSEVSLSEKT
jgi:hypothetical protein